MPLNQTVETIEPILWLDEKGKVDEPLFADYYLSMYPMKCFHNKLFTVMKIRLKKKSME